jgi:hypothetical protein
VLVINDLVMRGVCFIRRIIIGETETILSDT